MSKVDDLLKLKGLLDSGLINEEDFKKLKEKVLLNNEHHLQQKEELNDITNWNVFGQNNYEIKNEPIKQSDLQLDESKNSDNNKKTIGYVIMIFSLLIITILIYVNYNETEKQIPFPKTIEQINRNHSKANNKESTLIDSVKISESDENIIDSSYINNNKNQTSNMALQDVKDLMTNYYQDICNENFDVNNYYAYHVNQFINLENIYAKDVDYQINTIAKKEFRDTKINIISDVEETNSNDGLRYFSFSIEFGAFRVSKNKMTSCNVDIEIGLNEYNKISSYKELKYYNYKSY
ncbi:hypothetical protein OX284_011575 [Flavobacterium sp. SUN046]|uniref:hypothetical protein n=1 Tax=Flavobacterium sp. SUN046 TaxID=3002440 RepID=UPI002DBE888C|nr:hypothetical protein [Flavobacterium sp. SUN046]MEC4050072.1 hypothetical protein [Flavobacterium sp. SUN046]